MNNSPIDEYYFWKNLIEEKQEAYQPVPDKMFELLALAEMKMIHFLTRKHRLSGNAIKTISLH
jgi:hypothetical protein